MTMAAGSSTSRSVPSAVSENAFFVALDKASTPMTRPPWPRKGIDKNVAIRPSSSPPRFSSGSMTRRFISVDGDRRTGRRPERIDCCCEEFAVVGLRRLAGNGDVGAALFDEQHAGHVVVDEPLEHAEHLGDGLLEALRGRRDARHLGCDGGLEQLAVEQVAHARQHVVRIELERIRAQRRPTTASSLRRRDHAGHGRDELRGFEVLREVLVGAGLRAPVTVARGVQRSQKHDRDVGGLPVILQQPRGYVPRNTRHLDVEDDRVGMHPEHGLNRFDAILSRR